MKKQLLLGFLAIGIMNVIQSAENPRKAFNVTFLCKKPNGVITRAEKVFFLNPNLNYKRFQEETDAKAKNYCARNGSSLEYVLTVLPIHEQQSEQR